jgi:hypothetical protein
MRFFSLFVLLSSSLDPYFVCSASVKKLFLCTAVCYETYHTYTDLFDKAESRCCFWALTNRFKVFRGGQCYHDRVSKTLVAM